ncbi:hypothetical protein [Halosimplex amylolyticum]|uniref:hypothetical protein n=1 Tax=Halosimplex amylolyticum TaxID=3396616 RepID=UPI003F568E54
MPRNTATDARVRTNESSESDDDLPVRRATRIMRLAKLTVTTLAALVGVAKALGLL